MKGSYKSRWVIVIVVVIAAIAAFWFWQGRNDSQSAAPGATKQAQQSPAGGRRGMRSGPLAPVQAATAVEQAVPRYLTGLGTITAANTVTVRSRVDGQLMALHFQEGQQVKAGDLLAEIDPSQFKVALAQAQGQLAKDKATLANARRDLARYQQLAKTNLVSRQELDAQQALVSETEGTIKADEASVASAQLQLDWSRITAPVDGRVGLKQVDVGNQISSGDTTGIVVITQTHPIDLLFTLPESDIATVVQAQKAGKPLVVEAWDRTNSKKLSEGTLLSLDNQIDATTGTIKVKARFNNQDDALFPNQFVNARMLVDTEQNAVVIPTAALQMGNEGHFVWVLSSDGGVVPLSSIAKVEQRFAPLSINHLDQFPVTTISFNVPDNYSLGDAVQAIMDTEKTLNLPVDITTQFQGSTLAFQSALGSTVWLIVAAVVAMYIVLGILYESFIHPITILSTLPTAGVGALLALLIAGSELDVIAIIGIILLIGIVKKNAIMMIDFALAAEREQGMSPREAIYQACLLRFRPILMTTLAALLGALPLMLSTGVGAELRRPLGIGMVGGLIVSQVLTLFTTPVIYLLFDRLALWTKSCFARHEEEA